MATDVAGARFSDSELVTLERLAHDEILAGLAHRFDQAAEVAVDIGGAPLLGAALAAAALRANLEVMRSAIDRILRRTTSARSRVRLNSSDPLAGQLDLPRLGLRVSPAAPWPIVRAVQSRNTPENALLIAGLREIRDWAARAWHTYAAWVGRPLFGAVGREAADFASRLEEHFGPLELTALGAPRLMPLARERLAFRQANPAIYADAVMGIERSLPLIDPRAGQLSRVANALSGRIEAMLGGANESGLPNDIFELWVVALVLRAAEEAGYSVAYPHEPRTPFALAAKAGATLEVWWQSAHPIVKWPSGRDTERHHGTTASWRPVSLRPDLTLIHEDAAGRSILFVECKNKKVQRPDSKDVAQALGYLAHYDALTLGALVYREFGRVDAFRRRSTGQGIFVLGAEVGDSIEPGRRLLGPLGV